MKNLIHFLFSILVLVMFVAGFFLVYLSDSKSNIGNNDKYMEDLFYAFAIIKVGCVFAGYFLVWVYVIPYLFPSASKYLWRKNKPAIKNNIKKTTNEKDPENDDEIGWWSHTMRRKNGGI